MSQSADRDKDLRLAGFGVWRWNLRTNTAEWDQQMHALYGFKPREFSGRIEDVVAATHPDDREEFQRILRTRNAGPTYERRIRRADDGQIRWIATTTTFREGAHGRGVLTGISWDSTERHQLIESQRASESHLQQAHRLARLATWTWDVTEEVRWSPEMFELYDAPHTITPTKAEHDALVHPDDRTEMRRGFIAALESGLAESQLEYRVIHSDGSVHHLLSRFRMQHDASGRVSRILGVMQDVTDQMRAAQERLELESQLHQAQRLESLGTLAGGIAHDFNNILLAIGGNAQLALEDCPPDSPLRVSLIEIEKARTRASELVRRILAFGRPAAHDRKPTDLAPVVGEAYKLLRAAVPAMVELRTHLLPTSPLVMADAGQIHQVVMNLVTNASQAIGERGGVVEIALEDVRLNAPLSAATGEIPPGRYLRLTVSDNGPGIDPATRARMFEPFFTTKTSSRGTGLGLAVVHGIIKGHHGAISVTSSLGAGTRIDVYLPVSDAAASDDAASPPPVRRGSGQRVLYLDDEESITLVMARTLERWGYRTTTFTFTDPVLAVAAVREQPNNFDVVVTDLAMPGMTGFDVARSIREIVSDVPIVLTSGRVMEPEIREAKDAGIRGFAFKPNAAEDLLRVLDEVFHGAAPGAERKDYGAHAHQRL